MADSTIKFFMMMVMLNIVVSMTGEFSQPNGSIEGWAQRGFMLGITEELGLSTENLDEEQFMSPQGENIIVQTGGMNLITIGVMFIGIVTNVLFGTIVFVLSQIFTSGLTGVMLAVALMLTVVVFMLQGALILRIFQVISNKRTD